MGIYTGKSEWKLNIQGRPDASETPVPGLIDITLHLYAGPNIMI